MLFDGKALAHEIERQIIAKGKTLQRRPHLVSVLVGQDPASALYTRLKNEAAQRCGITFEVVRMQAESMGDNIRDEVRRQGARGQVTGVMVQMPIPGLTREEEGQVLEAIPQPKDVDGLRWEQSQIMPATVRAVLSILEKIALTKRGIWKRRFVVCGRGSVGAPLTHFLLRNHKVRAEVAHSQTENMAELIRSSEVVISCVGKPGLITASMLGEGAIAIDVGISKVGGKVVGDMTQEVYQKARLAVPIPGGVGPVTVACLVQNAFDMVQ